MEIRPIDGNALVARLGKIREEMMVQYDRLRKGSYERVLYYGKFTAINEAIIDIEHDAPTLDYAPVVHGEWIEQEITPGDVYYTCSVCKEDWFIPDGTPDENFMHYCPRCGAKMDGGKNDGNNC